jgi:hypothetical protein
MRSNRAPKGVTLKLSPLMREAAAFAAHYPRVGRFFGSEAETLEFNRCVYWARRAMGPNQRPSAPQAAQPAVPRSRPRERKDNSGRSEGARGGPDSDLARRCQACGVDISHMRSDAKVHSATCRKRKQRHPENPLSSLERVQDLYLRLAAVDHAHLQARANIGCRCDRPLVTDGTCNKCARARAY